MRMLMMRSDQRRELAKIIYFIASPLRVRSVILWPKTSSPTGLHVR